MSLILYLVLLVVGSETASSSCPHPDDILPCRCRAKKEQIQVWCKESDLESVTRSLRILMKLRSLPVIDELILENNKMKSLPARAFGPLRIGRLLLRSNGLVSVSRNAFAGLETSLEEIYIVEEALSLFPYDAIEQLQNLEAFTMERSRVRLLPNFSGLNRLKHIRMDGSEIGSLPLGAFSKLPSIKQIHIVNSSLQNLAEGIFGPLGSLLLTNFSSNKIQFISRRTFNLLPRLEVLSLAGNELIDGVGVGRALQGLRSLKSVDISNNKIKVLNEGSFVQLPSLQVLNLSGNGIQDASTRAFSHLPALRRIDMSNNKIRDIPVSLFDSTPLLQEIKLSNNLLRRSHSIGTLLQPLPSVRELDLAENSMSHLSAGTIRNHNQIQMLNLCSNRIVKIEGNAFENCPSLVELNLRNNSLESVSVRVPTLKVLDISSNKIQNLTRGTFSSLPGLTKLDLSLNGISTLGPGIFSHNMKMVHLNLFGNGLRSISSSSFTGLRKLKELDLSRNEVELLESGALRELVELEVLNLSKNRIKILPPQLLHFTTALTELSLKGNSIQTIPEGFLINLRSLRELNLRQNLLSYLGPTQFFGLKNMTHLKLSQNQLTTVHPTAFSQCIKLKLLDLSSNRLKTIQKETYHDLAQLEKFLARENGLTFIEPGAFERSGKIQLVDFSENGLKVLPELGSGAPLSLRVADFSGNRISGLDKNGIAKYKRLIQLNLNQNQIKEIEKETFQNMDSLSILDLGENELTEINTNTFRNLPRLIYLRLSRNKLRVIHDKAFVGLPSLEGMELEENELERIEENAFEFNSRLKYLNLSWNYFQSFSDMGLRPLVGLRILDLSYNQITNLDPKILTEFEWLMELRLSHNGVCFIPPALFEGMKRLRVLILTNNSISHFNESYYSKIKSKFPIMDLSENPFVCCENLLWYRVAVRREEIAELDEATCAFPPKLKGQPIRRVDPKNMICSAGNQVSDPIISSTLKCPPITSSRRKPRPKEAEPSHKHFFREPTINPDEEVRKLKKNSKLKFNLPESNDNVPGDTPTIYARPTQNSNKISDVKVSNGLSALSNLFGIPIPKLDFGLNLGISPSLSLTEKGDSSGRFHGQDPLPSSWVDPPSKDSYTFEPAAEYIPRKPSQPYIPLNPVAESHRESTVLRKKEKWRGVEVTSVPQTSWHPSYPTIETGFIPIQPFFHSVHNTKAKTKKKVKSENEFLLPTTTPIYSPDELETDQPNPVRDTQTERMDTMNNFWEIFSTDSYDRNTDVPFDFSDPIDTRFELESTPSPTTTNFPTQVPKKETNPVSIYRTERIQRPSSKGKSTITKVKLEESNSISSPVVSTHSAPMNQFPGIPPVLIGGEEEPLDWYYRNYHSPHNPEAEIEKYLKRSGVKQSGDRIIEDSRSYSPTSFLHFNFLILGALTMLLTLLPQF